jgi:hypothetical protein
MPSRIDAPVLEAPGAKEKKVYVEVPSEDMFDMIHPDIIINGRHYKPGKHFVEPELAGEIKRLVDTFNKGQVRLLRPSADRKALNNTSQEAHRKGGQYADPSAAEFN